MNASLGACQYLTHLLHREAPVLDPREAVPGSDRRFVLLLLERERISLLEGDELWEKEEGGGRRRKKGDGRRRGTTWLAFTHSRIQRIHVMITHPTHHTT